MEKHVLNMPKSSVSLFFVALFLVALFFSSIYFFKKLDDSDNQHAFLYNQLDQSNNIESIKTENFQNFQKPTTNSKKKLPNNEFIELVKSNAAELSNFFVKDPSKSINKKQFSKLQPLVANELKRFEEEYDIETKPKVTLSATGKITSLFPSIKTNVLVSDEVELKNNFVKQMINDYPILFGASDISGLTIDKEICNKKTCSITVNKEYQGLQSWDQSLVFTSSKTSLISIQGNFSSPTINLSQHNKLTEKEIKNVVSKYFSVATSDLKIHSKIVLGLGSTQSHDYIGYKLNVSVAEKGSYEVRLNSRSKEVVEIIPLRMNFFTDVSGLDLDEEQVQFRSFFMSDVFFLMDDRFPEGNFTVVLDANSLNFNDPSIRIAASPFSNSGWNKAAISAIKNTQLMMDYFNDSHNYDALANDSKPLSIVVNATLDGGDVNNAYWIPDQKLMVYGKGDGYSTKNFASALDVHAHELTHGVISSTSNLAYVYQSGALNESFADFFGALIDDSNWTVGEDLFFDGSAMRSLSNPNLYGQPGHMSEYSYLPLSYDNGGVHINSGIPNRALYLLAEGLSNEGLGISIGRQKTGSIAWATMVGLSNRASFDDAANLMIAISETLFGVDSQESVATKLALKSVGLPSEDTTITSSATYSQSVSTHNSLVYLNPIYSPSIIPPSINEYDLYAQILPNSSPTYSAQTNFGPLNEQRASSARPATVNLESGDFIMFYRGVDGLVYAYESEIQSETMLDFGFTLNDISVSSDANLIAMVADEAPVIVTINPYTFETKFYEVMGPDFTESGRVESNVEYIDTLRFDPTSRKIIFDYLTCPYASNVCTEEGMDGFWSIGILDLNSEKFFYPFPKQNENANIGYPTFSNLSEQYIAFDLIVPDEQDETKFLSQIIIYDLYSNQIKSIAGFPDTTDLKTGFYGLPSFTADDTGIIYSSRTNNNQSSLFHSSLDNYTLSSSGDIFSLINPYLAYFPFSVPATTYDREPFLTSTTASIDFGDVISGESKSKTLCVSNNDLFSININKINSQNDSFNWQGGGRSILNGQELCSELNMISDNLLSGPLNSTISVIHDGANNPYPINITANILSATDYDNDGYENSVDAFPNNPNEWLDTDFDGIGNNADPDDDGDGVLDEQDVFPLNILEWQDFDQDGIGDNSDNDDDNDGVVDSLDNFPLDSSRWANNTNDSSNKVSNTWDFDQNGVVDALTDGLMLLRYTFGVRGDALIAGAIGGGSDLSVYQVEANLADSLTDLSDIDGNGSVDALTDGLILLRYLFGLRGDSLISGTIAVDADRVSASDIETYIQSKMP
jgi:Zn-dependent metalloprotease